MSLPVSTTTDPIEQPDISFMGILDVWPSFKRFWGSLNSEVPAERVRSASGYSAIPYALTGRLWNLSGRCAEEDSSLNGLRFARAVLSYPDAFFKSSAKFIVISAFLFPHVHEYLAGRRDPNVGIASMLNDWPEIFLYADAWVMFSYALTLVCLVHPGALLLNAINCSDDNTIAAVALSVIMIGIAYRAARDWALLIGSKLYCGS